jgi:NAD(P)-dependent dehydrogenase (short-subunit alcohol dehydrogenase family)
MTPIRRARRPAPIKGKVIVVTGAASGLGFALASRLHELGAHTIILDRDPQAVQQAAGRIGPRAVGFPVDIRDRGRLDEVLTELVDRYGKIDTVIANAAVGWFGAATAMPASSWEEIVEINLLGTWRTIRATIPHLKDSHGYLMIVTSMAATGALPGLSAYAASKAALESLGRTLRLELSHHDVQVGVAYYGFLDTPMLSDTVRRHPGFSRLRQALPGPLATSHPVELAAAATVEAIERRAPQLVYPGWLRGVLALRGLLANAGQRPLLAAARDIDRREPAAPSVDGASTKLTPLQSAEPSLHNI